MKRLLSITLLWATGTVVAFGFPITRVQVCEALVIPPDRCEQTVSVLGEPVARIANPDLKLLRPPDRQKLAQLRCEAMACLPFYVRVADSYVPNPNPSQVASQPRSVFLIHAGDIAVLVEQSGSMRLSRRVVCEQPGRSGDLIRVRFSGTQQRTRAVVVARGELRKQEVP